MAARPAEEVNVKVGGIWCRREGEMEMYVAKEDRWVPNTCVPGGNWL